MCVCVCVLFRATMYVSLLLLILTMCLFTIVCGSDPAVEWGGNGDRQESLSNE